MKYLFIIFTSLCLSTTIFSQSTVNAATIVEETISLNWLDSYKEALQQAKKSKKLVLLYFKGSDWCGPCKVLDKKLFNTTKFKNIADKHFILYEVNIPMNIDLVSKERLAHNKKLAKKFKINSYPTLLFINHKQKVKGIKKGKIITEYYYPYFDELIARY